MDNNGIRVFFGIPAYGGQLMAAFVRSYLQTQQAGLIQRVCHIDGDSLVSRARNNLTAEFLKSDCTHLLFIDTDIVFDPSQVKRLIKHAAKGLPIIAGLYPKKQAELAWVINTMDGEKTDDNGLRRVKYAGTGFMLIARDVFERAKNAYPHIAYVTDHGEINNQREVRWDFWQVGVHRTPEQKETEPGRYLSEDWYFCQMLEEMGVPVMMDMTIHTKHVGTIAYPTAEVPLVDKDGKPIEKEQPPQDVHIEMQVPQSAELATKHVFDGEYLFVNPTEDGDLIYDIGANAGAFALWARQRWPNSPIVSFEPCAEAFDLLIKNTRAMKDIQLVNSAVLERDDEQVPVFAGADHICQASLYDMGYQNTESAEMVDVQKASELPPANFYKIDTEGCELEIIQALDLSEAKAVILEFHRAEDYKPIKDFMSDSGFECVRDDRRQAELGILAFVKAAVSESDEGNTNS